MIATAFLALATAAFVHWVEPVGVIDGDKVLVRFPAAPAILSTRPVRLRGINAGELGERARCKAERESGLAAREALAEILRGARRVDLLNVISNGETGRIVATVVADGKDVSRELLARGVVAEGLYSQPWCNLQTTTLRHSRPL